MTDNDFREVKSCLEKLGIRVAFTSDLSVGYLRFSEGDGQITRYANKSGDYIVVKYPGNPNSYYLNGSSLDMVEWIVSHCDRLIWRKVDFPDDVTNAIVKIRESARIYQTSAGKWHVSFNNRADKDTAAAFLRGISEDLAKKYSLQMFGMPIEDILSADIFLYGENGVKFVILNELVRISYPKKSHFDRCKMVEEFAGAEHLLWAKDFVLAEAFPKNKKIDFQFPVATKLLAEDEIVVHVHSFVCDSPERRLVQKKRESNILVLPAIPTINYIETPEIIAVAKKAKQLCKKLYIPKSALGMDERNEIVQSLWAMANAGSIKAAELLGDCLQVTMIKGSNPWPLYLHDPIGQFLANEKQLNLGGYPYNLNQYFDNEFSEHQLSKENLSALVAVGSGLAAIIKADILIAKGGKIEAAKVLYRTAAQRGYSVGWRALYCIYLYEIDKAAADEALEKFYKLAPEDHTNWGRLEAEISSQLKYVSKSREPFSLRSCSPKSAVAFLKRSR